MQVLLLYDITNDRIRTKVITACEDYGLDRFQFSAFQGELSRNHQEELMLMLDDLLDDSPARIQLFPISSPDWDKRLEVGNYA